MRLWTIHPKYLDRQGLVAEWREGLLAQAVLERKTKGYKNHPQLNRFKTHPEPLRAIAYYLNEVYQEAMARGYNFDITKINHNGVTQQIKTTYGQLVFETNHLLRKLEKRNKIYYELLLGFDSIDPHSLFKIIPGDVEDWERGE